VHSGEGIQESNKPHAGLLEVPSGNYMSTGGEDRVISRRDFVQRGAAVGAAIICLGKSPHNAMAGSDPSGKFEIVRTDEEWDRELTSEQYAVLRRRATERPWSSSLNKDRAPAPMCVLDAPHRCFLQTLNLKVERDGRVSGLRSLGPSEHRRTGAYF